MVHHKAFTGKRNLSPFNFIHNNVEYLSLCQDSRQIPAKVFKPQFNNGQSVREFYDMFLATRRHLKDLLLSIDCKEFNDRYSLFVFNLNLGDNDTLFPISNGNLRVEMRLGVPLPHTAQTYRLCLIMIIFWRPTQVSKKTSVGGLLRKNG